MPFSSENQRRFVMSLLKKNARRYGRKGALIGAGIGAASGAGAGLLYGGPVGAVGGAVGGAAAGAAQGYITGRFGGMGYEKWKMASRMKHGVAPSRTKKAVAAGVAILRPLEMWGYGTYRTRRKNAGPRKNGLTPRYAG